MSKVQIPLSPMNLLILLIRITVKNDRQTSEPVIYKHFGNLDNIEIKSSDNKAKTMMKNLLPVHIY